MGMTLGKECDMEIIVQGVARVKWVLDCKAPSTALGVQNNLQLLASFSFLSLLSSGG